MAVPLQLGFSDHLKIHAKKRTRRQRFLDEMEATVPWEAFLALIEPCCRPTCGSITAAGAPWPWVDSPPSRGSLSSLGKVVGQLEPQLLIEVDMALRGWLELP